MTSLPQSPGQSSDPSSCGECPIHPGRRAFLRGAASAAALTAFTIPAALLAEPVRLISAAASTSSTHTYDIPPVDGVNIDKKNEVILVRWQGSVYAFNLSCPHQNTALRWDDKAKDFQCPKHHSRYQPNGAFIDGRATRGMDRLAITKAGGQVVVDLDRMFKQDVSAAEWNGAVVLV